MRYTSTVLALCVTSMAACSDSSSSATITVNGRLIDMIGYPLSDASVRVGGKAAVTASGGTFSVTDVTTPYDITVVRPSSKVALVFRGLTRSDPTLEFPFVGQFDDRSAVVRGTITGGAGFPQPSDYRTQVVADLPQPGGDGVVSDAGGYTVARGWQQSATITANVQVLQWRVNAAGLPLSYAGYGSRPGLMLSTGADLTGQDIALSPVASSTLTGAVTPPTGLTLGTKSIYVTPASGKEAFWLARDSAAGTSFNYITPNIQGAKVTLAVNASNGGNTWCGAWRTDLAVNSTGLNITIPTPPVLELPAAGATSITTNTTFSWTGVGGVNLVMFEGPADQPLYAVLTAETSTTIPEVSAFALELPRAAAYRWTVYRLQLNSADDATGSSGYMRGVFSFSSVDGASCSVGPRTVTTAP